MEYERLRQAPPANSAMRLWLRPFPLVFVVSTILAVRFFRLISHYAVNIFFSDQWDFDDATLFQRHTLWQMFSWQHGPHRQGLGAILAKFIEPYLRWNSRAEGFLAGAIVGVALLGALYLKKRLFGAISFSDLVIPAIFLTPAQYESLWITPNFSHGPLPLLLIVLYCLAWTCSDVVVRYVLVLLVNFVAIYTGFGLLIGFITPLALIAGNWTNLRTSLLNILYLCAALLLSIASIGSFFRGYTFQSAVGCFSTLDESLVHYASFAALMFVHFSGARGIGAISVLAGSAGLAWMCVSLLSALRRFRDPAESHRSRSLVSATLISYCLLFCGATALGRLCVGLATAHSSRYTNYITLGVLGLYFYLLTIERQAIRNVSLAVLLTISFIGSVPLNHTDRSVMVGFHNIKTVWRNCYLKGGSIEQCDQQSGFWIYPAPEATHLKEKLDYLRETKQNLYSDLN